MKASPVHKEYSKRGHTMNYQGNWISYWNYGRILFIGDVFTSTIVSYLQSKSIHPVDAVYANKCSVLCQLAIERLKHCSYHIVVICEGDIQPDIPFADILPTLRAQEGHAKPKYLLATAPPKWLKSEKYQTADSGIPTAYNQSHQLAQQYNIQLIDLYEIAKQYKFINQNETSHVIHYFAAQELKRLRFSRYRKIKKEASTPAGVKNLIFKFLAIKITEILKKEIGRAGAEVLWENSQSHENSPVLMVGDSNMRIMRSIHEKLKAISDIYTTSGDFLHEHQKFIFEHIMPSHRVICLSVGTHHLSSHYSDYFENQLNNLLEKLHQKNRKVILINVTQRATERRPHLPDTEKNEIIEHMNTRLRQIAYKLNIPYIDAYSYMKGKSFEDYVHYKREEYTELSATIYKKVMTSLNNDNT